VLALFVQRINFLKVVLTESQFNQLTMEQLFMGIEEDEGADTWLVLGNDSDQQVSGHSVSFCVCCGIRLLFAVRSHRRSPPCAFDQGKIASLHTN
jgi:hypothetical protein